MASFKLLICLAAFVLLAVPSAQAQTCSVCSPSSCGALPASCPGGDSGTLYCGASGTNCTCSWIQNCQMTLSPTTPTPTTTAPVATTTAPATTTPVQTTTAPVTTTPVPTTTAPVTTTPVATTTAPVTTAPVTTTPAATTTLPVTTAPITTRPNTTAPVTTTPAATTKTPLCPSKPDGCTCDGNTPVAPKGGWPSCKDRAFGVCRPVCRPKSSDPCQCEWANSCEAAPACSATKRKACNDMCSSKQKSTFDQGSRCLGKPPGKADSNPDWQCSWSEAECDCKWSPVCPAVPPTCLSLPTSGDGCGYLKACMNVRCPDSCTLTLSHLQDGFCSCPFSQSGKTWADKIKMCVADKMLKELQGVDSGVSSYNASSDFCSATNAPTKSSSLLGSNYAAKGYCSQDEAFNGPFYVSCEDARQSFGRYYQECSNSTNTSACDLSCGDRNAMLTNVATGNYSASDLRIFRNMLTQCGKAKYSEMKMEFRSPGRVVMQKRHDVYNKISQILNISTDYCSMFSDDSDSSNDSAGVYSVYIVIFGDSKVNATQATSTLSQPGNQAQLAAVVSSTLLRASDCIGPCPLSPAVIGPLGDNNQTGTNNQTQFNNTLTPFQNQTSPAAALFGPGPGALALLALLLIVGAYEVLLH